MRMEGPVWCGIQRRQRTQSPKDKRRRCQFGQSETVQARGWRFAHPLASRKESWKGQEESAAQKG